MNIDIKAVIAAALLAIGLIAIQVFAVTGAPVQAEKAAPDSDPNQ